MLFKAYCVFCALVIAGTYGFGMYECNQTVRKDRIILSQSLDGQILLKMIDRNQIPHY